MITVPRKNLYLTERKWGQKKFQRGIICATAVYGGGEALSVIVAANKSIIDLEFSPTNAIAQVQIGSGGSLLANTGGGFSTYEVWLDSGLNSQAWVQRVIISGTLSTDAGAGRLACTSSRTFGITNIFTGTMKNTTIDLNFYDAVSGGSLLDTQRVALSAEVLV